MAVIYHMLPADEWQACQAESSYAPASLVQEGFIHCTGQAELVHVVANRFYREEQREMLVLAIDEARVQAPVAWEEADDHLFPHIYGPLNLDAIVGTTVLLRDTHGHYLDLDPEGSSFHPHKL